MRAAALAASLLLTLSWTAAAEKFRADDPLQVDADDLPSERPQPVELSGLYDLFELTYAHRPHGPQPAALNANTLGEVPDSSWFENRIGVRRMSIEEAVRGAEGAPPTPGPWTVIAAKVGGITPGFTIKDAAGRVYFVKFDSRRYPHLSTAADVIGSRFFHAFGYHVPANHIAHFQRHDLSIGPGARVTREPGKKSPMTERDLDALLARVDRSADGSYRCVASERLPGEPLGPHRYVGTRPDDPNDVIPHQHRRDLRGLGVFSAWLNHDDSRSLNSLDMYRGEPGAGHVRHYLIDFSSTLGAGSNRRREVAPQDRRPGNEYFLEKTPALRSLLTLGLWDRSWRHIPLRELPEVGRIEADYFAPERWKPEYPNPAFERMDTADAFWAARIVARFDDELVRALVHLGEFDDPEAERHLADVIVRRRDKTARYFFRQTNPIAGFRLGGEPGAPTLEFDNEAERAGLDPAAGEVVSGYEVQWFDFDNRADTATALAPPSTVAGPAAPLPAGQGEYLMARVRTLGNVPVWRQAVDVYLRRGGAGEWTVVGVERGR